MPPYSTPFQSDHVVAAELLGRGDEVDARFRFGRPDHSPAAVVFAIQEVLGGPTQKPAKVRFRVLEPQEHVAAVFSILPAALVDRSDDDAAPTMAGE